MHKRMESASLPVQTTSALGNAMLTWVWIVRRPKAPISWEVFSLGIIQLTMSDTHTTSTVPRVLNLGEANFGDLGDSVCSRRYKIRVKHPF